MLQDGLAPLLVPVQIVGMAQVVTLARRSGNQRTVTATLNILAVARQDGIARKLLQGPVNFSLRATETA